MTKSEMQQAVLAMVRRLINHRTAMVWGSHGSLYEFRDGELIGRAADQRLFWEATVLLLPGWVDVIGYAKVHIHRDAVHDAPCEVRVY